MVHRPLLAVAIAALVGACRAAPDAPPPEAPWPFPEYGPEEAAPDVGWRYGGCAFDHADKAFAEVPLEVPAGVLKDASVLCRVQAIDPFAAAGDENPDLRVGVQWGTSASRLSRSGPDDSTAALFVFAPVTLAPGDTISFLAQDRDFGSKDETLGRAEGIYQPDRPLSARSDKLSVTCAPLPASRLAPLIEAAARRVEGLLAILEGAAATLDWPDHGRPESAFDAARELACMSELAGPDHAAVRSGLERYVTTRRAWDARVRATIERAATTAAAPGRLDGTPLDLALTAPRCGDARLPEDAVWGISAGDAAPDGTRWCLVGMSFTNRGEASATVRFVPSTTPRADALDLEYAWAISAGGRMHACVKPDVAPSLAPGEVGRGELACALRPDEPLAALVLKHHFGQSAPITTAVRAPQDDAGR